MGLLLQRKCIRQLVLDFHEHMKTIIKKNWFKDFLHRSLSLKIKHLTSKLYTISYNTYWFHFIFREQFSTQNLLISTKTLNK